MNIFTQGLQTERMDLVPLDEKFGMDIMQGLDEQVTQYMTPKPTNNIADILEWIRGSIAKMQEQEKIVLIGVLKENSEFIGSFSISNLGEKELKAGLWTKQTARGKGYGREGMLALIEYVKEHFEFDYILYPVDKDNRASRKVAELAGGILQVDEQGKEIVERKPTLDPEQFLNAVNYRIYKHANKE